MILALKKKLNIYKKCADFFFGKERKVAARPRPASAGGTRIVFEERRSRKGAAGSELITLRLVYKLRVLHRTG